MFELPGVTITPEPENEEGEELTTRQELFVQEYVKDWNASRAARAAGYSTASAGVIGYELLQRPHIKRRVRFAKEELLNRSEINRDWILERLKRIAETDMRDVAEWGPETKETRGKDGALIVMPGVNLIPSEELTRAASYSILEIGNTKDGVKVKMADKRAALMDIAKMLGLVTDKIDHSGKVETVVTGPDVTKMTTEQLQAWEAFLLATAAAEADKGEA